MSARDERPVGHVPAWVWDEVEERPPYPPGYEARVGEVSAEEELEARERFAASYSRRYPDEPPLDPDSLSLTHYETADPDFLDALHPDIPTSRLYERMGKWETDARELHPSARAGFWTRKAEAVERLDAAGYIGDELMGMAEDLISDLRRKAREAALHGARAERSANEAADELEGEQRNIGASGVVASASRFHHYVRAVRLDNGLTLQAAYNRTLSELGGSRFRDFDSFKRAHHAFWRRHKGDTG